MGLILRVDVDKPYGNSTIFDKVISKLKEDYWFPSINKLGYLKAVEEFIKFCNKNEIRGIFYFRNVTIPNKNILKLLDEGQHYIGFHAESTLNFLTFEHELNKFKKKLPNVEIHSFTKHGSGRFKLGKNHYPPYEPKKYKNWAVKIGLNYIYGNEVCSSKLDFENDKLFFSKMFWIHQNYRDAAFNSLDDIIEIAKYKNIPIIIHPSNFVSIKKVREDFSQLVRLAKSNSISWDCQKTN